MKSFMRLFVCCGSLTFSHFLVFQIFAPFCRLLQPTGDTGGLFFRSSDPPGGVAYQGIQKKYEKLMLIVKHYPMKGEN